MKLQFQGIGAAVFIWLFACFGPALAQATPEVAISENLIVVPDPKATATSFWMIVKAGCRDEENGECHGMAHYVEHLVFLGRNADHKSVAVGFFADAQANGYTTHISTVYTQKFPLRTEGQMADLEKLFRFHAERLVTLDFSEDDAVRERGIVRQEYALRFGNSPTSKLYYQMERTLHPAHPIGQAAIGSIEDIEGFSTAAARRFHQKWYSRDNAIFVVHGPVEPDAVRGLYDKYVGALPKRQVPERDWLNTRFDFTPMSKAEALTDKAAGQKSWWQSKTVRYPEENQRRFEEALALTSAFLNSSLDGSPKDTLVDKLSLAKSFGYVSLNRLTAGGLEVNIQATPEDATSDDNMGKAFNDFFTNLAHTGISEKTLERLKKRAADQFVQRDKRTSDVAESLVGWLGAHRSYADYRQRREVMAGVTLAEINLILATLAEPGRSVTGTLSPAP